MPMTAIIDALMRRFTPARYHRRQFDRMLDAQNREALAALLKAGVWPH